MLGQALLEGPLGLGLEQRQHEIVAVLHPSELDRGEQALGVAKVEPPQTQTRRQQALGHARRLHQLERARVDPDRLGILGAGRVPVDDAHVLAMSGQLERRRETGRPGADHQDRQLLPGGYRHTMRSRMVPASVCPGARTRTPVPSTPRSSMLKPSFTCETGSMQKKSWPGGT